MKGDFTRQRFSSWKLYSSVRMQQGRVQLDSDWNEDKEIELHRLRRILKDVAGDGVPEFASDTDTIKNFEGLAISSNELGLSSFLGTKLFLTWSPLPINGHYVSRFYCNGNVLEISYPHMDGTLTAAVSASATSLQITVPSLTMPDGQQLKTGTVIVLEGGPLGSLVGGKSAAYFFAIITATTTTTITATCAAIPSATAINTKLRFIVPYRYDTQPFYPNAPALPSSGIYIAYLDIWERHVTAVEDSALKEPALGGPDTTSRTQVVWQLKLLSTPGTIADLNKVDDGTWADSLAPLNAGTMKATYTASQVQSLENRLYRVEIHAGGVPSGATVTFKWSRDNGSIAAPWVSGNGPLTVATMGRDEALGFAENQWLELIGDPQEMANAPGVLVKITAVASDPSGAQLLTVTPPTGYTVDINNFKPNPRVRRWDGASSPTTITGSALDLENGIQVQFDTAATYQTGDHWLIPARSNSNGIEWPLSGTAAVPQAALRIRHSYLALDVIDMSTKVSLPLRRRLRFPSVTALAAKTFTRVQSVLAWPRLQDGAGANQWKFGNPGIAGYNIPVAYNNNLFCTGFIPVYLPDKVTVKGVAVNLTAAVGYDIGLHMLDNIDPSAGQIMFSIGGSSTAGVQVKSDFANGPYVIDNSRKTYYMWVTGNAGGLVMIISIMITYTQQPLMP